MSTAIFERLKQSGTNLQTIVEGWVLKDEQSFDVKHKLASYIYQYNNSTIMLTSGAPETIVEKSQSLILEGQETPLTETHRSQITQAIAHMAHNGERLLAFGYYRLTPNTNPNPQEQNLVLVGIIGFLDPPRPEVQVAIQTCQQAGIRVIMITGDHPQTAQTIAEQVGIINNTQVLSGSEISSMSDTALKAALCSTSVFARATPEDKLRIVKLLRTNGEIVAVTGDGINDAPPSKKPT